MLKLSLTATGLFEKSRFTAWTRQRQVAIHKAVASGMQAAGKPMVETVRSRMQSDFAVNRPAFLKSMRHRVYDRDPNRLPALWIGSRIPWLGIHVSGGTIRGPLLIPLLPQHQRIGRKAFRRVIDGLMKTGNAWFIRKNGKVILMAEAIRENATELRRFKRAERQRTGAKSIRRGTEIPVAVLVPNVSLKRRFDLAGAVHRQLPALARAIEERLNTL